MGAARGAGGPEATAKLVPPLLAWLPPRAVLFSLRPRSTGLGTREGRQEHWGPDGFWRRSEVSRVFVTCLQSPSGRRLRAGPVTVLSVSWDRRDGASLTGRFTEVTLFPHGLEARTPESGWQQVGSFQGSPRGAFLGSGCITPVSPSVFTWPPHASLCCVGLALLW